MRSDIYSNTIDRELFQKTFLKSKLEIKNLPMPSRLREQRIRKTEKLPELLPRPMPRNTLRNTPKTIKLLLMLRDLPRLRVTSLLRVNQKLLSLWELEGKFLNLFVGFAITKIGFLIKCRVSYLFYQPVLLLEYHNEREFYQVSNKLHYHLNPN